VVDGTRLSIDEAPVHVRRRRDPVDVDHVVFPLDPASVTVRVVILAAVLSIPVRHAVVAMSVAVVAMSMVRMVAVT
jgi:hypothetical protein